MKNLMDNKQEKIIKWFEKMTGLSNVSIETHMDRVECLFKKKYPPNNWSSFHNRCPDKNLVVMPKYSTAEFYQCFNKKHPHKENEMTNCQIDLCPLI